MRENIKIMFCQFLSNPSFPGHARPSIIIHGIVQDFPMHQLIFKYKMVLQIEDYTVAQELFKVYRKSLETTCIFIIV